MMVFLNTSYGKQAFQTAREKNTPCIHLIKSPPCTVKRQVSLSLKNITAIKSSCWRLFMVINKLILFQSQTCKILMLTVKQDQNWWRKIPSSETAKMRKRKNTEQFTSSLWQVFSLFLQNQSIPTSLTLLKTLDMCKCLTALPAWGTAAGATLSSLAHHQGSQTQIYLCPFHSTSGLLWGDHLWYSRSGDSCSVLQIFLHKTVSWSISDTPEAAVLF